MARWIGLLLAAVIALGAAAPVAAQDSTATRHALAERLVQLSQGPNLRKEVQDKLDVMMKNAPDRKAEEAAWLRENMPAMMMTMMDRMMDSLADVYAETYDIEELQAQVDFFESPIGRRISANSFDLGVGVGRVMQEAQTTFATEIQTKYCAEFECEAPVAHQRSKN